MAFAFEILALLTFVLNCCWSSPLSVVDAPTNTRESKQMLYIPPNQLDHSDINHQAELLDNSFYYPQFPFFRTHDDTSNKAKAEFRRDNDGIHVIHASLQDVEKKVLDWISSLISGWIQQEDEQHETMDNTSNKQDDMEEIQPNYDELNDIEENSATDDEQWEDDNFDQVEYDTYDSIVVAVSHEGLPNTKSPTASNTYSPRR